MDCVGAFCPPRAEDRLGSRMTVGELIEKLSAFNPDRLVILSGDAEGNAYSPLDGISVGYYEADSTWSGEWYGAEDEECPEDIPPAIVLWPVN